MISNVNGYFSRLEKRAIQIPFDWKGFSQGQLLDLYPVICKYRKISNPNQTLLEKLDEYMKGKAKPQDAIDLF